MSGTQPARPSSQYRPTSSLGSTGSPARGPSPKPRVIQSQQAAPVGQVPKAPPRSHSPRQTGTTPKRAESPLRQTGSSVDYTSTQWDSDEYETESEEEPAFQPRVIMSQPKPGAAPPSVGGTAQAPARPGFPTPQSRPQQPTAAPRTPQQQQQQVRTIISKSLDDDDDDEWMDSDR